MSIGVAFLGIGHAHAPGKLRAARDCARVELIGVCEPEREIAGRRRDEEPFRDETWFAGPGELLDRDDVEAVIVDGLVRQNAALAEAALGAGKHVLLEKPAGRTLAEFQRLRDLAAAKGVVLQMGYQFRYIPGFTCLRRLVSEGVLGRVFFCRARIGKDQPSYERLEAELRDFAGGTMFELGCHPMDFIIGLMGRPTAAKSVLRTDYGRDTPLADNTVAVLEFAGGIGVVESSMMEIAAFEHRRVEIYGTEGTAVLQPFTANSVQLSLESDKPPYRRGAQTVDAGDWPMFAGDIEEFAACIRGEKAPDYGAEHDWWVHEAVMAVSGVESPY